MEHIGLDLHKQSSQFCILTEDKELLELQIRTHATVRPTHTSRYKHHIHRQKRVISEILFESDQSPTDLPCSCNRETDPSTENPSAVGQNTATAKWRQKPIAERREKVMSKPGRRVEEDSADIEPEQLSLEYPALSACYGAALQGVDMLSERAGRPCLRVLSTPAVDKTVVDPGATAVVRGFNLHGKTRVDGRGRQQLEKLCRYIARPPIAQQRLYVLQDGRVRYDMKRVWKNGTKAIVLSPLDLIARLCALVPPPYFHLTRFHGLLAPNSRFRTERVPQREQLPGPAQQLQLFDDNESSTQDKPATGARLPWAWLLKRVFKVDITICLKCSGSLQVIERVTKPDAIAKRLAQAGMAPMPPPKPLPVVSGQLALRFDFD